MGINRLCFQGSGDHAHRIPVVPRKISLFLFCPLALLALVLGSSLRAQDVASVVGTVAFPVGENRMISVGVPLVRPAVAAGVVELVDSGGVTLINGEGTPQAVAANLLEGSSYYIEVVGHRDGSSSTALGHRFEIDEPATKAQSAGKIVLGDSHLNTLEKNSLALIVGHRVVVRPHWTLAGIFGTGTSSPLNSSVNPAEADQVYFSTAKGLSVFYFRGGVSPQWRSMATGPVNQDGAIIPPGVGVFFKRQKNAATFTVVGEVRAGRFVRSPVLSGQLIVSGFPVSASLADLRLLTGAGLTSGATAEVADQVFRWDGAAFEGFFLRAGSAPAWQKAALDNLDYSGAKLLEASSAILVRLKSGPLAPLVQSVPFSL